MTLDLSMLAPPVRLAVAYAQADLRHGMALLLAFDDRIAGVVSRSTEPLFAQMRIAWWREALEKPRKLRPKGEPLLVELERIETVEQDGGLTAAMRLSLDAWEVLAANEEWTSDILHQFADLRCAAVFGWYAAKVGTGDVVNGVGRQWALDDLSQRYTKAFGERDGSPQLRLSRQFRPLSILAFAASSASEHISGPRLIWHALTGR